MVAFLLPIVPDHPQPVCTLACIAAEYTHIVDLVDPYFTR